MKSYKKFLCIILAFAMLIVMSAGCSSKDDNPAETSASDNPVESSAIDNSADTVAFSYSDGIDENGYFKGVKALDYVEIFNYKALPVPKDKHQVSENDLQTEVDSMLDNYSSGEQIKDRAVVDGDTVNIDYVGSVDGVEFEGGSTGGAGTDVTIGVTSYIDDFLQQLIGHTPGETINVEVTFPDVYQNESLQSKDAVFVTTINYIVEKTRPELTDDFVKTNFSSSYGWETVSDMKDGVSAELRQGAIEEYINNYLYNEVTVSSVPDALTKYQEEVMILYYQSGAEYYGMEFDEFLSSYMGVSSVDELIETNSNSILQNAKYTLAIQAVAEDLQLSVSEEDMIGYFTDYSTYEEQYGLPYLKQMVLFEKVLDYITDNVVLE